MPYVGKKRIKNDPGITIIFPDPIQERERAAEIHKELENIASNPDNWHLDSSGRPYLVDPKTKQTISGMKCPPGIDYVLKKKEKGQQEPKSIVDIALGRWSSPPQKKKTG